MSRRQFRLPERTPGAPPPDDSGCGFLHVDMDAFYAAASLLDRPELVGTPVIVGGGSRGVVLSATYEARAHGVTSAMPMTRARALCPGATILRPDFHRYQAISRAVMAIFDDVTPVVEPLSMDEAFLDVSGARRLLGSASHIAAQIRARVQAEQGMTCSVGVASSKLLAKLASGLAKPDGLLVIPAADSVSFIQQLPIGALWGVGDRTEEVLLGLGLRSIGDIAHAPPSMLQGALGAHLGPALQDLAWARDRRSVVPTRRERSIGADETFERDVADPVEIHRYLLGLSQRATSRMRTARLMARTVSIKVRFTDFRTITRSRTLPAPTDVTKEVYAVACELYDALGSPGRVRLVGVRMEGLLQRDNAVVQPRLDTPELGWREAEAAADAASARFGSGAVRPAALVRRSSSGSTTGSRRGDLS